MYRVETASRKVEKEIVSLEKPVRERVMVALGELAEEPRPLGSRKLSGKMKGAWRIRVGDFRVLYDIHDDEQIVVILAVLHRRDAYR